MFEDCLAAKRVLDTGYTCVICYKGMVFSSNKENVLPLVEFLDSKFDFSMFSICNKIISKSIAVLIIKLKIKNVFTYILTSDAKELFDEYGINYRYNELVSNIENKDTNLLELDNLIESIDDIDKSIDVIYRKIKK